MPLRWATIFRVCVLAALTLHEFVMYRLARTMGAGGLNDTSDIVLAWLFALAMLVPLVWAVTLPELPEIYTHVIRAKSRFRRNACPACGYQIGVDISERDKALGSRCTECGIVIEAPREYAVTRATIWRFAAMNLAAWMLGCLLGEWSLRFLSA